MEPRGTAADFPLPRRNVHVVRISPHHLSCPQSRFGGTPLDVVETVDVVGLDTTPKGRGVKARMAARTCSSRSCRFQYAWV